MTEEIRVEAVQNAEDLASADDARLEATMSLPEGDTTPPPEEVAPTTDEPEQSGEQPATEPAPPAAEPQESAEQKLARLEAQVREKEAFIQRQANEVGMLRRIAARPKIDAEKVREEIREQFQSDPVLATKRLRALEQYEEEVRRDTVIMHIPDLPNLVDTMAIIAKADGESDQVIEAFRRDPLKAPPQVLHDLAVRARAYRWAKSREQEILSRDTGVSRQTPPAQQAPVTPQAFQQPRQAPPQRQGGPVIKGSTPGGASTSRDTQQFARVTERDISMMSDAELDTFLAKGRAK